MSVKILAIDDDPIIRRTVANSLRDFDCIQLEAADGIAGLAVASRERPNVILLDYKMPVMDGTDFLARLRWDPELKDIPVVMLTSEASRDIVVKVALLGVRDYLIKPFQGPALIDILNRLVSLKPKVPGPAKARRESDPIHLLVVDDQPAIHKNIRAAVNGSSWKVTSANHAEEALALCLSQGIDVVLASLNLPDEGAYRLLQNMRGYAATSAVPLVGLCLKNAVDDQAKARAAGFCGILTKPIEASELKSRISRALKLDDSSKHFKRTEDALILSLPKDFSSDLAKELAACLSRQLAATVNAGGDKLIFDLTALPSATPPLMELLVSASHECAELSVKCALFGLDALRQECQTHEESKALPFAEDYDKAAALLK